MNTPTDNIANAAFSRDGRQLLIFDRENQILRKSANLAEPYKLQTAITFNEERHFSSLVPTGQIIQDIQYRFDSAQLFFTYNETASIVQLRRYDFVEVGNGWKLFTRNNLPFLPIGYRGNYITDTVKVDLNNPTAENRQYSLRISDSSQNDIDYTYKRLARFVVDPIYLRKNLPAGFISHLHRIKSILKQYSNAANLRQPKRIRKRKSNTHRK